jgi:hypothetical protein
VVVIAPIMDSTFSERFEGVKSSPLASFLPRILNEL